MNKVALVTGAGSGIGRAISVALANRGFQVLGVGRRVEPLLETKNLVPDNISIISADIGTEIGRQHVVDSLPADARISYLIHNAATIKPILPIKDMTINDWRHVQAINVEAPLFLTQKLLKNLEGSRILNISAGLAHYARSGLSAYCTSKAALFMLYQCLRTELADMEIVVGSMRPGTVDSAIQDILREESTENFPDKTWAKELKEKNQLITPKEVATFTEWLLFDTTDKVFSEQEWDVRDQSHHRYWRRKKH